MSILDFLFPKYCVTCKKFGSYLCANCFARLSFSVETICLVCNKAAMSGLTHPRCQSRYAIDGAFSAITYNPTAKKLLYVFKYKPYVADVETILCDLLYENMIQNEIAYPLLQQHALLVPIPLHKDKLRKRGYNQSELLAKGLGKRLGVDVVDILERVKKTESQFGLKREERLENIRGAFGVKPQYCHSESQTKNLDPSRSFRMTSLKGRSIFLIDDVLTTGSTLFEAAKVLKKSGVGKVYGVTLARD